jgi:hypothetical protein
MFYYAFSKISQNQNKQVLMALFIWVTDCAVRPLVLVEFLCEVPSRELKQRTPGKRPVVAGGGSTTMGKWRGSMLRPRCTRESLQLTTRWPEVAGPRGAVATRGAAPMAGCSGGLPTRRRVAQARGGYDGGDDELVSACNHAQRQRAAAESSAQRAAMAAAAHRRALRLEFRRAREAGKKTRQSYK